jgi:hypothetical protein
MKHAIYSRSRSDQALSIEEVQQRAPAAFSASKADHLTDRYVSLTTSSIIPIMKDYGFDVVQAAQKRSSRKENQHGTHLLAFADTTQSFEDGTRPEIVLFNSNDGSSSVRLFAGIYRMVCSNGIVAGEGFESRTYHNKRLLTFEDNLRHVVSTLPTMMARVEKMKQVRLDHDQVYDMAVKAVATRWDSFMNDDKRGAFATASTVNDVLRQQRLEDVGNDAWLVFNKVQENVIRGNAFVRSITEQHPEGVMRKARPINSIKEAIRINRELWDIAEAAIA